MKRLLLIITTNWIHILGFYIAIYISGILFKLLGLETEFTWDTILLQSFFTIPILFVVYGLLIIGGFYATIIVMDVISFTWKNRWVRETLVIEWLLISLPFFYWAVKYGYWYWFTLSASLLATQVIRSKRIKKILE